MGAPGFHSRLLVYHRSHRGVLGFEELTQRHGALGTTGAPVDDIMRELKEHLRDLPKMWRQMTVLEEL